MDIQVGDWVMHHDRQESGQVLAILEQGLLQVCTNNGEIGFWFIANVEVVRPAANKQQRKSA